MKFLFTALLFWTALLACGGGPAIEKEKPEATAPVVDEDDLLTRLSMLLVSQPRTQAQTDQNTIANYAIDNLLDVRTTPSGLFYQILAEGQSGDLPPRWGDVLSIHYTGTFLDGRVFDTSAPGKPLQVKLKQVIPGWQEALQMMRKGGKGLFIVPSHLAYGEKGFGKTIAPNTILKFEIELVDIDRY